MFCINETFGEVKITTDIRFQVKTIHCDGKEYECVDYIL